MEQIAVEPQYLEPSDLSELIARVNDWARVVSLPPRTDGSVYRSILQESSIGIGSPRPSWILGTKLRLIQLAGVGYEDYVGVGLEDQPQLAICNARGVLNICIAEHVMAMMLALCRQLPYHLQAQRESRWAPKYNSFVELTGQTLVVVCLGDIGGEVAQRAVGLGMRLLGVRRDVNATSSAGVERVLPLQQLPEALRQADQVVVALPGGKSTRHLVDAGMIAHIKPGAFLYNVGRGAVVDQSALIAALQSGHLAGAGLDVFEQEPLAAENPLWQMPQVIITPHIAGYSPQCAKRFGRLVIENVERYRNHQTLRNRIPTTALAATS